MIDKNLIIKVKSGKIVYMNEYAKNVMVENMERYIVERAKEGKNFNLLLKDGIYRCGLFENDCTTIFCVDMGGLRTGEWELRRKLREEEKKYNNARALMDMTIHDMKNYAFLLKGYMEIIEKEGFKGEYNEEMKKIIGSMRNLLGKISVMLKSSEHIKRKRININMIIGDAVRNLRIKAESKGIKIIERCDNIYIRGDPIIGEAFMNIIDNAIKYSPSGTSVVIECMKDGDAVIVRVSDEGRGIPEEIRDMIFERFKRGRDGIGMGLGLAVTKHIVDLHGGRIWVEENPKGGSVFCISLPAK